MTALNSISIMLYGWLRRGQVKTHRLTRGLCLAFDPDKRRLTISRLSAVNEFGFAISPPSEKERYIVLSALLDALAAEAAWIYQDDGYVIDVSDLLMTPGIGGKNWYLYRFTWHLPGESEEE